MEHAPLDFPETNITRWAGKNGRETLTANLARGDRPLPPERYDWLFVMGGSPNVWEEDVHDWLPMEKDYIRRVLAIDKPVFGVCFGAQLVAEVLGARVFTNK